MDYKEKYEQALKVAKETYNTQPMYRAWLERMFPELKESEDEKVREELIKHLKEGAEGYEPAGDSSDYQRWLAWLERQSEQKPTKEKMITPEESLGIDSETYNKIVDECIFGEWKPTNKIEPKFREGEWITNGDYTWKIVEIKLLDYILQSQDGNIVDDTISHVDEQFHSFTIQDAKDGDVLTDVCGNIGIYNKHNAFDWTSYCSLGRYFQCFKAKYENEKTYPATKEQRDLLFQNMKEKGYEWDAEKKELKKINSYCQENCKGFQETGKCFADGDCKAKKEAEQKPAWSEEEEHYIRQLESMVREKWALAEKAQDEEVIKNMSNLAFFLKTLNPNKKPADEDMKAILRTEYEKGRADAIAEMQKEWSEEDAKIIDGITSYLCTHDSCELDGFNKWYDWLKSLRPQNRWKPSDEQLKVLHDAAIYIDHSMFPCQKGFLMKLYKQLKKLK